MSELSTTLHSIILFFYFLFLSILFFFLYLCRSFSPFRPNKKMPSPVLMDAWLTFYLKTHKPTSWILLTSALQFYARIYLKHIRSLCRYIFICVFGFRSLPLESQTQSHYFLGRIAIYGS